MNPVKITPDAIRALKRQGGRIAMLTAYDYPTARLLDECGIPLLLVGDSLGMVVLGYPDTTRVTMAEMEHHTRAAARAQTKALLGADLPYRTYDTPAEALANAKRLVAAGAEFVKAEGGREILPQIQAIHGAGIPFVGHLGMLPQHVLEEGGKYRIKGRDAAGRAKLWEDAAALAEAGVFAVVLELVAADVARQITENFPFVTLGIGSGPHCDGQVLVTPDLIGTFPWFTPKFVRPELNAAEQIRAAVGRWQAALPSGVTRPAATD
ncbi:MAG TPA: 3-methyl-2-oxobutanoate hydroxymethyltransferase [Verrucomicrobiota bacterium]|nr:3-methyl-2-oxobutanoate hydroxymethyltransferase [Verrucomicrobiota bacterium]HNT16141.1 3-methyl-2-oxobutanoate hydroxymethyltransferase [Verrucomicrobiota bacterium]